MVNPHSWLHQHFDVSFWPLRRWNLASSHPHSYWKYIFPAPTIWLDSFPFKSCTIWWLICATEAHKVPTLMIKLYFFASFSIVHASLHHEILKFYDLSSVAVFWIISFGKTANFHDLLFVTLSSCSRLYLSPVLVLVYSFQACQGAVAHPRLLMGTKFNALPGFFEIWHENWRAAPKFLWRLFAQGQNPPKPRGLDIWDQHCTLV